MAKKNIRKYNSKKYFYRFCFSILDYLGDLFFSRQRLIPEKITNILVFRPDHLGDVVFSIPSLEILKENYPEAKIDMVIGPWSSSLFENIGQLNARNFHILEFSCPWLKRPKTIKFGFLSIFQLVKLLKNRIREIGKNYDIAIDLRGDFQLILAARIARIPFLVGRGSTGLGFLLDIDVPNFENKHLVESNLFLLEESGLGKFPLRNPQIKIDQENTAKSRILLEENKVDFSRIVIGIHPGAGLPEKRWACERFAALIEMILTNDQYQFVLFGGPDDSFLIKQVIDSLPKSFLKEKVIDMSGQVDSLGTFMGVVKNMNLYIGNDSGPTHIASAISVPVICIFQGINDPVICRPLGDSSQIVSVEPKIQNNLEREYPPPSIEEVYEVVIRCV